MKLRKTLAAAGALAIAGGMLAASPSQAAQSDTTTVTFQVNGGLLTLTQAANTATLTSGGGAANLLAGGDAVSGTLPAVTVSDGRSGTVGFSVNIDSGDFTTTGLDTTPSTADDGTILDDNGTAYVSATGLGTVTGLLNGSLVTTASQAAPVSLNNAGGTIVSTLNALGSLPLLGGVLGTHSVTYTPTVSVVVPANAVAGTYTGTVTQTAS